MSDPTKTYDVWVAHPRETIWYRRWECNCAAGRSQHYAVCIHKAAVYVRLREANAGR